MLGRPRSLPCPVANSPPSILCCRGRSSRLCVLKLPDPGFVTCRGRRDPTPQRAIDSPAGFSMAGAMVICAEGHRRSQGVAAWLREEGGAAEYLEGGQAALAAARLPLVDPRPITARDAQGRSLWVTRSRPKIDRIACPWLIRCFIDPRAVFLYVAPAEVVGVTKLMGAMPYDSEGVFWSHRDELCTFDAMLAEFGISTSAHDRIAPIVRGADTVRPDLTPEAAGLLAASLGLSRMYADDLEQLEAGMAL